MNRTHSHRNLLWSGHWPVVFHKRTGTLLYSLFVSWSFYWQSNGRVEGFTMCILSDAYCYSIISENQAIKWNDNFLTIYIENNVFNVEEEITVKIENKDIQLEYIGGLKDFYAQRIVNKIFNHALRIGVDLPHIQ